MKGYVQAYIIPDGARAPVTAGIALRAAGAGFAVYMARFDCSETDYQYLADRFSDLITVENISLSEQPAQDSAETHHIAEASLQTVKSALTSGKYDMVIVENTSAAVRKGLIRESQITDLIDSKPDHAELILTGNRMGQPVIEKADLVTEMKII